MNTKSLQIAVTRMIEKLPEWNEDAIIYRHPDGTYDCDPRSTYDTVSREHEVTQAYQCHDLDDVFPGFCEDDADWLLNELIQQQETVSEAASTLGRLGGRSKSAKKQAASRGNGRKGGRPKKTTNVI